MILQFCKIQFGFYKVVFIGIKICYEFTKKMKTENRK